MYCNLWLPSWNNLKNFNILLHTTGFFHDFLGKCCWKSLCSCKSLESLQKDINKPPRWREENFIKTLYDLESSFIRRVGHIYSFFIVCDSVLFYFLKTCADSWNVMKILLCSCQIVNILYNTILIFLGKLVNRLYFCDCMIKLFFILKNGFLFFSS